MHALIPKKMDLNKHSMRTTKSRELSLRDVEIFQDCSEHFVQSVYELSITVIYLPGEVLRTAGTKNAHIWVVMSGDVHIVDGMHTVLHRNHVVGIYSQINNLGFCVYTAYAARNGAICIRISRQTLHAIFTKYPQDKCILMRNSLKFVNRRPLQHIITAMHMQVRNTVNQFIRNHTTKLKPDHSLRCKRSTHSNNSPGALDFTASKNAHSTPAIEMVRLNRFTHRQNKIFPEIVPNHLEFPELIDGRLIHESVCLLFWNMVALCVTLVMSESLFHENAAVS